MAPIPGAPLLTAPSRYAGRPMKPKSKGGAGGGGGRNPRADAARLVEVGLAAARSGAPIPALEAYANALRLDPQNLDAHMNAGMLFAKLGKQRSATKHLRRALTIARGHPGVSAHAAALFVELGQYELAIQTLSGAARSQDPFSPRTLGVALVEVGRAEEAIGVLERAVALEPSFATGHVNLHRALYAARGPAASMTPIRRAAELAPEAFLVQLALANALGEIGDHAGARAVFDRFGPGDYPGARSSWEYMTEKRGANTPNFATTKETLDFAMARSPDEGLVLELGVRFGTSIRWLAQRTPGTVHGFDSFDGLPESWNGTMAGQYTTHGEPPETPPNVELHVGLFDATLPAFVAKHEGPVRCVNIDCDLYSSTKTVFDALSSRIVPGSVLVFDEYLVNDDWKEDEYKAFQEAAKANGWRYEYIAFSLLNGQACVRIV